MRWLIIALLLVPLASASTLTATYVVSDSHAQVNLSVHATQALRLPVPDDATGLLVDGNASTRPVVLQAGPHTVSYTTASVLEHTTDRYFVVDFGEVRANITRLTVELPPHATLVKDLTDPAPSVHPLPTQSRTDGTHLIFSWQQQDLEPSRAVFIAYQLPDNASGWYVAIALALALVAVLVVILSRRLMKRTEELTKNLFEEEKQLVEILTAHHDGLWQKELQQQSGMSKVKVSRKLRSLEAKGVVEKIPYGNTNKIRLKK